MSLKAAFLTLGCKVNAYETEAMSEQLASDGFEIVPFGPGADIYIINTCTVTGIADRKSRQMIHRAREMNPDAVVAACGCYAESAARRDEKDGAADLVIGNASKQDISSILTGYLKGRGEDPFYTDINQIREYDSLKISDTADKTRAYLKIEDGCNQFCTYCMIPYVRGRTRSRKPEEILAEAGRLAEAGFREVVLTGIHISSYGLDFEYPDENRMTPEASEAKTNGRLLDLIRRIAEIPGISRVRLGSLEPGIVTPDFLKSLGKITEFCPQFHLSLQSGSDTVLSRMKRRYRTEDYRRICGSVREFFPDAGITTDIIAGFPGETEEEFRETYEFADEMKFSRMHIFKYSKRKGTKAAAMPGQVPDAVRRQRSRELISLEEELRREYNAGFIGRTMEVLFEEPAGKGRFRGHTKEAVEVEANSDTDLSGQIRQCVITGINPGIILKGEVI